MKYLMIAVAILAVAGCTDQVAIREKEIAQVRARDDAAYGTVGIIQATKRWRMDGGTFIEVFTDPGTRCEYLITGSGKAITPRMSLLDTDGITHHICN